MFRVFYCTGKGIDYLKDNCYKTECWYNESSGAGLVNEALQTNENVCPAIMMGFLRLKTICDTDGLYTSSWIICKVKKHCKSSLESGKQSMKRIINMCVDDLNLCKS